MKIASARKKIARAQEKSQSPYEWYNWQPALRIPLTVVLILTSVMFIAISTYGGMRLESDSQLSFSSQVGSTFSVNGSLATVSMHVTATKLARNDWVFVDVYAVPAGTSLKYTCVHYVVPVEVSKEVPDYKSKKESKKEASLVKYYTEYYTNHCITDPCVYLIPGNEYDWPNICDVILNGSIDPDAAGDVDQTLSVPFKMTLYEDVDVRAEVCVPGPNEVCEGSAAGQNSRLDWAISQPK